jgi:hypothetical protein
LLAVLILAINILGLLADAKMADREKLRRTQTKRPPAKCESVVTTFRGDEDTPDNLG